MPNRIRDIWDNKLFRMSWAYREWRDIVDNLPPRAYQGSFPLDQLKPGQFVRSAGDGTGACEVGSDADGGTVLR